MTKRLVPRLAVAAGTWSFTLVALLVLPLIETADPGLAVPTASIGTRGWWLTAATFTIQAVALLWARRTPRTVLLTVSVVPLLASITVDEATFSVTRTSVAVAVFLAGLMLTWRELLATLIGAVACITAGEVANTIVVERAGFTWAVVEAGAQAISIVIAPLLFASVFASRREAREAHRREVLALAREREALVLAAVAGERAGMARELHDIAAHHLSGIALIASAIDQQIDADPEAARRSVRQVRAQSGAVLNDLRRLVGLLRDDAGAERPEKTLTTVSSLVQAWRAAGMPVEMRALTAKPGQPLGRGIGPLAQLVAYRMVQESLTNSANHAAGAPCIVEIDDRDPNELSVTVTDTPVPTGSRNVGMPGSGGFGLMGMREQAELVGAELRYGIADDGGWAVNLVIPRYERHGAEQASTAPSHR